MSSRTRTRSSSRPRAGRARRGHAGVTAGPLPRARTGARPGPSTNSRCASRGPMRPRPSLCARSRRTTGRDLHLRRWRRRRLSTCARHRPRRVIDAGEVSVVRRGRADAAVESVFMADECLRRPVEAWPYRLMPEYGPEGSVLPLPTKGNEVRVATIHRYKGLESAVVVLAEIDSRIAEADLAALLYVGATRARSHLVIVASDQLGVRLGTRRSLTSRPFRRSGWKRRPAPRRRAGPRAP